MPLVRVDRPADHIAVVTLDRPEVLNALSIDLAIELDRTLLEVSRDNTVRVIVLQDVDIAVRHPESFSAMLDALTA